MSESVVGVSNGEHLPKSTAEVFGRESLTGRHGELQLCGYVVQVVNRRSSSGARWRDPLAPKCGHNRISTRFDEGVNQIRNTSSPTGPTPVLQAESVTSFAFRCKPRISRTCNGHLGFRSIRREYRAVLRTLFDRAGIRDVRFHDLRHTFASWYMVNGGDLSELTKVLGHSNIKMTERYAKLGRHHIAKTGSTVREIWKLLEQEKGNKEDIA